MITDVASSCRPAPGQSWRVAAIAPRNAWRQQQHGGSKTIHGFLLDGGDRWQGNRWAIFAAFFQLLRPKDKKVAKVWHFITLWREKPALNAPNFLGFFRLTNSSVNNFRPLNSLPLCFNYADPKKHFCQIKKCPKMQ